MCGEQQEQGLDAGGEEAAGHMVKGFGIKLDQIGRGGSQKKRGSRPGLSYRTITGCGVKSELE